MQAQTPEQQQQQQQQSLWIRSSTHSQRDGTSEEEREDEDEALSLRSTVSAFRAKEEQIERKKMEIRERVFAQLGRVEEEGKTLATIRKVSSYCIDYMCRWRKNPLTRCLLRILHRSSSVCTCKMSRSDN